MSLDELADEMRTTVTRQEISYILRDGKERRDQSVEGQIARQNHEAACSS